MSKHMAISVKLVLISTILLGLIYPLLITGLAQALFSEKANGSPVRQDGRIVGSMLLGQSFARPAYFHPRPSAAGNGYDASASSGSNLGPTSKALVDRVRIEIAETTADNRRLDKGRIPVDMVTTSGSGLDPDISPANAYAQAGRVAAIRGLPIAKVRRLIQSNITARQFGVLGEPRANVLRLNLALDQMSRSGRDDHPQDRRN